MSGPHTATDAVCELKGQRQEGMPSALRRLVVILACLALYGTVFGAGVALGHTLENPGFWTAGGRCTGNNPVIAHVRDGKSFIYVYGLTCGFVETSGPGTLGVRAHMYKDGAWCDSTGLWYNSGSTTAFGVGKIMCSGSGGYYVLSENRRLVGGTWYGPNYRAGPGHNF